MKLTKSKLKEIIREELIKERNIDPEDAGQAINYAIEELEGSLKKIRNPENWAEKYVRSLPGVIDMMERLSIVFSKMK